MSKELEIEFKTLLTKDEYIKLCEKFKDCKRNLQINYYFDTSRFTLKASDIGLRVRMLDKDKYIVTLKRKKGYVLQEINENINKETFDQFLSTGIVPVEEIQKENSDVVGWILFESEPISYPILYSGDNETYLRHTYKKEYAIAGSIFVDGRNHSDFSDKKTLIYGHNMFDDKTMFSRLPHFLDEEYKKEHRFFQIITNETAYRYEISNAKIVTPTDDAYQYSKNDTTPSENPIIILSTCYNGDKNRVVLTSNRIDEYNF